jgi:hypothetical protein
MDCGSSWTLLRITVVAVVDVGRARVLLAVQAARKGKAPNWCSPSLARCFAAILPLFLSVRGCTSPQSLDFLGFIRPKRDFSMGYSESK